MKQIINNVLYDTEKAEKIVNYWFASCKRELYRGKTGYFAVVWDYFETNYSFELKDEDFVKALLGKINIDKYIELFGEPEQA